MNRQRGHLRQPGRLQRLGRADAGSSAAARSPELGAVTAELAVALPAAVVVLAGLLTGAAAGITQLRLEEAARAAARQVMRGEADAASGTVARLAGSDAVLSLAPEGEWVMVRVESGVKAPLLEHLPFTLSAQAAALPEEAP
ncbi:TadE family type IV pilus minor pilin [Arthrobacter sp. 7Tela_A1]|uniref:TadE family type IV pilus minor pilin n=1 Tax=Arthrobacter sp. 7Tela_A1 TaxID=3093745 RepID=UPI003BB69074